MKKQQPQQSKHHTPLWTIFLVFSCTLLIAVGQVMMKLGVQAKIDSLFSLITSPFLIIGFFVYALAGLGLTWSFKHGELSVLYPLIALGFIWVLIAARFFLAEPLPGHIMSGTALIFFGISLIGHNRRKRS